MDQLDNLYIITSIILSTLLIISEILGWSKCEAKAITQLHRCLSCCKKPSPNPSPAQTPRFIISWTEGHDPTLEREATDWSV